MTWLLIIAVAIAPLVIAAYIVLRPPQWVLNILSEQNPTVLFRVATDERVIALTIDDAPHPEVTPAILQVLRRHGVKATFFAIGSNAERYPELIDAIRNDGHELANHMFSDSYSAQLDDDAFLDELQRTEASLGLHGDGKWCRPGRGLLNDRIVKLMEGEGYRCSLASAYPMDTRLPPLISGWQFRINVRPGAILVLHDGKPSRRTTAEVLDRALPGVLARGYRIVTLTQLVAYGR